MDKGTQSAYQAHFNLNVQKTPIWRSCEALQTLLSREMPASAATKLNPSRDFERGQIVPLGAEGGISIVKIS